MAGHGHLDVLERLLAANAEVEAKDNGGLGEPSWVELEWKSGVEDMRTGHERSSTVVLDGFN